MKLTHVFLLAVAVVTLANVAVRADIDDIIEGLEGKTKEAVVDLNDRVKELEEVVSRLLEDKEEEPEEQEAVDDKNVVVLTGDTFKDTVAKNELTLVEFYAPWCGHCKALAPEYAKAADELEGKGKGVLAKVDCIAEENKELCNSQDVQGFPTIKLFRNDGSDPVDYDGGRSGDDIVAYMKKQSAPAVSDVSSQQELDDLVAEQSTVVLAFLADADAEKYTNAAKALRNDFTFARATGALASGVAQPTLKLYRSFDPEPVAYSGDFAATTFEADFKEFVKVEAFPLVGEIGVENYQQYYGRGLDFVWVFIDYSDDKQTGLIKTAVEPVAVEHKGKFSFVKLDGVKWEAHAQNLGLKKATPGVILEQRETKRNFIMPEDQEITVDSFRAFISGVLDGSVKPHVKSEEPPEDNSGPVKVVVGSTFDSIVMDDSKDVLVEFYAPWCGHCKALTPKYEELGQRFEGTSTVVIAKVDATENDTPADVQGFPTLIFYPAGDKSNPVPYEGARDVDDMESFIKEHAKAAKKDEL